MQLETVRAQGLAHNSYFLSDHGEAIVIDTREPGAFASSHVYGSLNIWLDGMSFFPRWALEDDEPVALVTERPLDVEVARMYLGRLGFDDVKAHLCGGIPEWRNKGKPFAQQKTCSIDTLKKVIDRAAVNVLDVRDARNGSKDTSKGPLSLSVI